MNRTEVAVGSLWQEADARHTRIVQVLGVGIERALIVTVSDSYKASRPPHPTYAKLSRFKAHRCTSHCGYFPYQPRPEAGKEGQG